MATCPFCNYEGELEAVEGHVSGKSDEAHIGKFGAEYREEIASTEEPEQRPGVGEVQSASLEVEEAESNEATEGPVGSSPGLSLVAATVVVALVVLLTSTSGESNEQVAEQEADTVGGSW